MYMWNVRDLDLGSMINLSTRVNKTWPNSIQQQVAYVERFETLQDVKFGFGGNCSPIEEYVILWFYILIKINSPSTLNRNSRISKSELYHISQQLSQHDYPIRIFPTSISVCIWNKLHASFYLKNVMNMSLLKIFRWSVVHRGIVH
jgi:hypothetical protein